MKLGVCKWNDTGLSLLPLATLSPIPSSGNVEEAMVQDTLDRRDLF